MNSIYFYSADTQINAKSKTGYKNLVKHVFASERYALKKLSIIFCSDDYLLGLNRDFLNHDFYTDILTFILSEIDEPVEGEIYISTDRIKENAKVFNVPYQNELLRVMIHGALHLCGYEDSSKAAKKSMREKENFYLKHYSTHFT